MDKNSPRVSVLTCAHNGERYLEAAVESILGQTFTDFEYLLVDAASSDRSPQIMAQYAARDPRVVLLGDPTNPNGSANLNRGLAAAHGEYVAVLDQDDLAYPERLARQVAYLDHHPEVGVVGTQVMGIDPGGQPLGLMDYPVTVGLSRWQILFGSPCLHSAAMMRRSLVLQAGGYSVKQWWINDYILMAALVRMTGIANLAETLVAYRRHPQQMASVFSREQTGQAWLLIHAMLAERLGLRAPLDEIGLLYRVLRGESLPDSTAVQKAADLLLAVWERYPSVEPLDPQTRLQIDANCARRLLLIAWVHRRSQRAESRRLLHVALEIDPQLWRRPETGSLLRRCRR
jgi:glycosyltransferase involved in cell wall biosynthesis